jgi:hypothetical protein
MKVKAAGDGRCITCNGYDCQFVNDVHHGIVYLFGLNKNKRCREIYIFNDGISELDRKINAPIRLAYRKDAIVVYVLEDDWDYEQYYVKWRKK